MSADPVYRLAKLRIIKLSADLEVQLASVPGGGPTVEILRRLQHNAAESLAALAVCDTEDPKMIRLLQNEVKRYDEWLAWMKSIVAEGKLADQEISAQEREEMLDYLSQTPEGAQQAIDLGLIDDVPQDE